MPSTLSGLLIFVALLVPGFVHYSWRRRQVPLSSDSGLVETANLVTVSLVADTVAVTVFAIGRACLPKFFFNPSTFLADPAAFVAGHPGTSLRAALFLLAIAIGVAWLIAERPKCLENVAKSFAPTILDVPAWYHVFEASPQNEHDHQEGDDAQGHVVYVAVKLHDGDFISGVLDWYSTSTDETDDRNLVLAPPFSRSSRGADVDMESVGRVVLAARDISVMEVTMLDWDWYIGELGSD